MPKKFDHAIKALTSERFRIIGSVAVESFERGINPDVAIRTTKAKRIQQAIKILTEHELNTTI